MPKPFRFSLERVLDYRIQLEERARLNLARAQQAYQAQADIVVRLRKDLARHEQAMSEEPEKTPEKLWLMRRFKRRLELDIRRGEERLLELAKMLNAARREAVAASRERKLLEKLKEKQAKRHVQEEQFEEQKEYDEMATIRYQAQDI